MAQQAYIEVAEEVRKLTIKHLNLQQIIREKDSIILRLERQLSNKKQSQSKSFQLQSNKKSILSSSSKALQPKEQTSIQIQYQEQNNKLKQINYCLQIKISDLEETILQEKNHKEKLKNQYEEQYKNIYNKHQNEKNKLRQLEYLYNKTLKENQILKEDLQNKTYEIKSIKNDYQLLIQQNKNIKLNCEQFQKQYFRKAKQYQHIIKQSNRKLISIDKFNENITAMKHNTEILSKQYNRIKDHNGDIKNYKYQLNLLKIQIQKYICLNNTLRLNNNLKFSQDPSRKVITKFQLDQNLNFDEQLKYIKSIVFSSCVQIQNELIKTNYHNNEHQIFIQQKINKLINYVKSD